MDLEVKKLAKTKNVKSDASVEVEFTKMNIEKLRLDYAYIQCTVMEIENEIKNNPSKKIGLTPNVEIKNKELVELNNKIKALLRELNNIENPQKQVLAEKDTKDKSNKPISIAKDKTGLLLQPSSVANEPLKKRMPTL